MQWVPPFNNYASSAVRFVMCAACNGLFPADAAREINNHEMFHQGLKETGQVSAVAWCDAGNHAFKAGEPGSQSGTMSVTDEFGRKQSVQFDTCKEHSTFQVQTPKELPKDLR